MPPSAFLVNSSIRTKTLSTPTTIITKSTKISDTCASKVQLQPEQVEEETAKRQLQQTSKYNQNNNCQSVENYNYSTPFANNNSQYQQNLHNMVLQSYENYATYHLPTHPHHHHNHQQQRNNQFQQQHYEQNQDQQLTQQHEQFQQNSIYQQHQNQSQHLPPQQQRLSSGSSASSSSTASSIVSSNTAASLGIGYFNELSNFVGTDFSATHHHAASNLYYTDIDANFFSQGKTSNQ